MQSPRITGQKRREMNAKLEQRDFTKAQFEELPKGHMFVGLFNKKTTT